MSRINRRFPRYPDDSDYNTNAPSYYDDLARKTKLIKLLAKRIWEYDEELAKRFEAWDKNLEEFDDEVIRLLVEWLEDGTLAQIINEEIFSWKADTAWVQEQLDKKATIEQMQIEFDSINAIFEQKMDDFENETNDKMTIFENETNDKMTIFENETNDKMTNFENETNESLRLQRDYLENEIEKKNAELEMFEDRNDISLGKLGAGNGIASWWTTPLAFRSYQYIFHGFTDNKGGVWVGRYDNERQENKYFRVIKNEVDDHNAPSVLTLSDGRVITFYSRHNQDTYLRYRISESVRDIDFGEEQTVKMDAIVTYAQAIVDSETGRLFLFTRVASNTWRILSAPSENITESIDWEINKEFVHFGDDNQGYLKIGNRPDQGMCRIAFSGHPTNGNMHDILYCYFRTRGSGTAGDVVSGGDTIKNILSEDWTPLQLSELQMVYDSTQTGKRARLFDIGGEKLEICFVEFTTLTDGQYKYATWNGNGFVIKDVAPAGKVFGGGSQRYYYGGMMFSGHSNSADIYVSRFIDNEWVIERYTSSNNGVTWNVRTIERSKYYKLMRPYAITNPSSFEQLMYSKGDYSENNFTDFKTIIKSW